MRLGLKVASSPITSPCKCAMAATIPTASLSEQQPAHPPDNDVNPMDSGEPTTLNGQDGGPLVDADGDTAMNGGEEEADQLKHKQEIWEQVKEEHYEGQHRLARRRRDVGRCS